MATLPIPIAQATLTDATSLVSGTAAPIVGIGGNNRTQFGNTVPCTTGTRPTANFTGEENFDTTLGIPIWWNGSAWVNAVGTPV